MSKSKLQKLIDSLPDSFEKRQLQKLVDLHLDDLSESYYVARMPEEEYKLFLEYKGLKEKQKEVSGIKSDVYNAVNRSFEVIQDLFNFISTNDLEKFKDDRIEKLIEEKVKLYADYTNEKTSNVSLRNQIESNNTNFSNLLISTKKLQTDYDLLLSDNKKLSNKLVKIPNWIKRIFIH